MISSPSINTLFVDIGGVLLTNGWDRSARQRAAQIFQLDYEDLNERHHLTFDTYEAGKLSLDDYLTRIVFYEARPFSREAFTAFMFEQSQPYPRMFELIQAVKDRYALKVAAVSNEGRELMQYRIQKFELRSFIDFFIASSFVHCRKPDRDIYRIALDIAQAPPKQVAYLEDRAMFVEVARSLGLHGIQHTSYEATRAALADLSLVWEPA